MTRRVYEDLLREIRETLAMIAAAGEEADRLRDRQAIIRKAAAARLAELEDRIAAALADAEPGRAGSDDVGAA